MGTLRREKREGARTRLGDAFGLLGCVGMSLVWTPLAR